MNVLYSPVFVVESKSFDLPFIPMKMGVQVFFANRPHGDECTVYCVQFVPTMMSVHVVLCTFCDNKYYLCMIVKIYILG